MNNPELQRARQIIENTGTHLFLTGKAGTGKTTFLRDLKSHSSKRIVVVAPTGIAAINAGGVTIHSFFQLPFAPFVPNTTFHSGQNQYRFSKEKINIIRSMDLLIIDEISMVRADLLDAIDDVLRRYRDRYTPFGGVQLLMIGDLQQLAPVVKEDEWNLLRPYYESCYFFGSRALQHTSYATIELKQVYRQSDPHFLSLLNKVRTNQVDEQTLEELNRRYIPGFQPAKEEGYIRLTTHNYQAQQINDYELSLLKGRAFSYTAEISGNFSEYSYPTDRVLTLKKGAQIMFVKNDPSPEKLYYNGMIGEIYSIDTDGFIVRTKESDRNIIVLPEEWANSKYVLNEETKEITEEIEGVFKQYLVKLAWAITIHKSQGLTFEHAIIDAHSSFAHGQAYVALSRCKTLEGMVLSTPLSLQAIISDETVTNYNEYIETHTPSEEMICSMQRSYFLSLVSELFDFSSVGMFFAEQKRVIDEHFYRLFPQLLEEYKKQLQLFSIKVVEVAIRFYHQYDQLISRHPDYDTHADLQARLIKGAEYFEQELGAFLTLAEATHLPTDNKELRKRATTTLENFWEALEQKIELLQYVRKNGFHVSEYLRQKAYILLNEKDKSKSSNGISKDREGHQDRGTRDRSQKGKKIEVPSDILHPELYQRLIEWRGKKSKEVSLPAYVIMQQRALLGITNLLPDNAEALEAVPYFGRKGVEKYGLELLGIIRKYTKEQNRERLETSTSSVRPKENGGPKDFSKELSYKLFKEGMPLAEIAQTRSLSLAMIYWHLFCYVSSGDISLEELVEPEKIDRITTYLRQHACVPPQDNEIRTALGDDITVHEVRVVYQAYKRN